MPVSSQHDVTDTVLDDALLAWAVRDAAQVLPGHLRLVLYLTDVEGLSYAQAGEVVGISPGAVAGDVRRARSWLRTWLGPAIRRAIG
ncbi:MAG TPA: sigma-70 family RNA polymerase sigma factor [Streptosporangiaceae bacterium]|jgi:RNA polymerase sigma-70 factor (ECF subfamily)|nr:sigma-70 family RNA polymerase sigma factor [Streptosporangiaceae bacterium]